MKKSKKLSLQSLALVLMSFILVAGVAFGMTGAWFTDTDATTPSDIALGNGVRAEIEGAFAEACADKDTNHPHENYMPGCTAVFTGTITPDQNSSQFRMRVKITVTGVDATEVTCTKVTIGTEEVAASSFGEWVPLETLLKGGDAALSISADVLFVGAELDNEDHNKEVSITIDLEILQAAHTTDATWADDLAQDVGSASITASVQSGD